MHLGHQALIETMLKAYDERHLLLIGSCNKETSVRHLFTYEDRRAFIKAVFPGARIAPLPDFEDDSAWFQALDDIVSISGGNPSTAVHIGGCQEDIEFFVDQGRTVRIINRFSGATPMVSGTQIRDALITERASALKECLDERIIPMVTERFRLRWDEVRKK